MDAVEAVKNTDDPPLAVLVKNAETLIKLLEAHEEFDIYTVSKSTIHLHRILAAMLEHAEQCGQTLGKRYTAAALASCARSNDDDGEKTLKMLRDLARTWLSHLLFAFKVKSSSGSQRQTSSEAATPTYDSTRSPMVTGAPSWVPDSFRRQVPAHIFPSTHFVNYDYQILQRDGYRCPLTGFLDTNAPNYLSQPGVYHLELQTCHIIRRAIARFDSIKGNDAAYRSALVTFDILRNYAGLPQKTIESLVSVIDDPPNGPPLEVNCRNGFESFRWCLICIGEDEYEVKILDGRSGGLPLRVEHGKTLPHNSVVKFEDHSNLHREWLEASGELEQAKRIRTVEVPNPHFIRIHAAIGGILHDSGANKFLEELVSRFGRGTFDPPDTWEDFIRAVEVEDARMELEDILRP